MGYLLKFILYYVCNICDDLNKKITYLGHTSNEAMCVSTIPTIIRNEVRFYKFIVAHCAGTIGVQRAVEKYVKIQYIRVLAFARF